MNLKGALAIFVKTPELSPVKTRLAAGIGSENALQFYDRSLMATKAVARQIKTEITNLDIIWAVAEPEALHSPRWNNFKIINQGEGDLGQRLHTVYENLQHDYDYVAFMGADSPHLSHTALIEALNLTSKYRQEKFVLGETFDGGFYYFGGSKKLPQEVWLNVKYSHDQTAHQLSAQLIKYGGIEKLKKTFDIDTAEDLKNLANYTENLLLPEQLDLIEWSRSINYSV